MDYRGFVTVKGPRVYTVDDVVSVLEQLELQAGELGPVASGGRDETMEFTVSADCEDAASAGQLFVEAVSKALRSAGFGEAYVVALELEPAD